MVSGGTTVLLYNQRWFDEARLLKKFKSMFLKSSTVKCTALTQESPISCHWPILPHLAIVSPWISEKAMAPYSSTLAWKIPWMEEPGRLYSPWGRKESDRTERLHFHFSEYICQSQSPNLSLLPYSLVTISFSTSVTLLLFCKITFLRDICWTQRLKAEPSDSKLFVLQDSRIKHGGGVV